MWLWVVLLIGCRGAAPAQTDPGATPSTKVEAPAPEPTLIKIPIEGMTPTPGRLPPRIPLAEPEGACKYVEFTTQCTLVRIEGKGDMRRIAVTGVYDVAGEGRTTRWSLIGDSGREADMKAHLQAHPVAECTGRRLVEGDCGPGRIRVMLPSLPAAK